MMIPAAALMLSVTACEDFLDTSSPSVVDRESVFSNEQSARSALYYGYQKWHDARSIHSVGWFWTPIWGSDIEDAQDAYSDGSAGCQEKTFYPGGTENYNINSGEGTEVFGQCYNIISICNSLISSFEAMPNFADIMKGEPNSLSDIYGQAVALRATCYFELTKWYGDVPLVTKAGEKAEGLTSRFAIYDYNIKALMEAEKHMYRPGEGSARADVMNRTYAQGLIARLAMFNGGYATRRTDIANLHVDAEGKAYQFEDWSVEKNKCIYGRRADWKAQYEIAETYLEAALANHGSIKFHLTDPRSNDAGGKRVYDNPFQYYFQQLHSGASEALADESVYEIEMEFNNGGDRPGYIGRPSTGGNNGAPCIGCGQDRVQAHFYYGWYDNADKRRDASCCVTGSNGKGQEMMQSFNRSAWGQGCGPGTNKWDWCRLETPNTSSYGTPGINVPYMRMAEIYLMYAEVEAALNKEEKAKNNLAIVHNRNFPNGVDPNFDKYIAECGGIWKAVIKERALEFVGEGIRRFDLIRTGLLPEACKADRDIMTAVVDNVHNNGFHRFDNGNELPAYVWTKLVDAKKEYNHRLTAQCQNENDPVMFPGWRGQHDDWGSVPTAKAYGEETMTNLAIKGLFKTITPGSAEAMVLESEGYEMTPWGVDMYTYKDSYATKLLCGYTDADLAAKNPPVYLIPMIYNDLQNTGVTNGYGFRQK